MNEKQRPHEEEPSLEPILGGLFDEPDNSEMLVEISNGHDREHLPLGGRTVAEVRTRFRDRFQIDPHSQAMVNGQPVGEDVVLRAGQHLLFMHHVGEKGGH